MRWSDGSGLYFNTKDQIQAFDPKCKHGIEQWRGSRCSITAYTVRGVDDLSLPDRDVLRTCGLLGALPRLRYQ